MSAGTFWLCLVLLYAALIGAACATVYRMAAIAVIAAVTLGGLWLAVSAGLALERSRYRSAPRPDGVVRIILGEALAFIRVLLCLIGAAHPRRAQPPAPGPHPLLLLHGVLCSAAVWQWLMPHLREAGYAPIDAPDLLPLRADIDRHAERVADRVRRLSEGCKGAPVTIIAHSMGGLIARAALRKLPPELVRTIVTLGCPHHGTHLAGISRSSPARQMRVGSRWLEALNREQEGHWPVPIVSLYSLEDALLWPARSARLAGARCIELRGVGHLGLLIDPGARSSLLRALDPAY